MSQSTFRILLIIGGGIAAYKSLELIRLLRQDGFKVSTILTAGGAEFIRPLSIATLSGDAVREDLFSLESEAGIDHIELSRKADLILIAPATANLLARMRAGLADDLASATLLASRPGSPPILAAPAMNPMMWLHPATQENCKTLEERGIEFIGPDSGDMACGETGAGRLIAPEVIVEHVYRRLGTHCENHPASNSLTETHPLLGRRILVTSGATREALDPVRFFSNHSSGKQGHAIAESLAQYGAEVCLISGSVQMPHPKQIRVESVISAQEMHDACMNHLAFGVDVAICVAAVADWRPVSVPDKKIKKTGAPPQIVFEETPDILRAIASHNQRPQLVIGFAAETSASNEADLISKAQDKRKRKGCDWIMANDVSPHSQIGHTVFGADKTRLIKITEEDTELWPQCTKKIAAKRMADEISKALTATL